MKYVKYFLIVAVAVVSLSSTTRTSRLSEGIYPGNLFADIKNLENVSGTKISLSDLKGQKVLVNLWAAYDATSHRNNVLLKNIIEKENYSVQMISISFDKSNSVFEKTIAFDKIDETHQFIAKDDAYANLFNRYELKKGFKNYLIDENGVIIAINIDANELDQLLKKELN